MLAPRLTRLVLCREDGELLLNVLVLEGHWAFFPSKRNFLDAVQLSTQTLWEANTWVELNHRSDQNQGGSASRHARDQFASNEATAWMKETETVTP